MQSKKSTNESPSNQAYLVSKCLHCSTSTTTATYSSYIYDTSPEGKAYTNPLTPSVQMSHTDAKTKTAVATNWAKTMDIVNPIGMSLSSTDVVNPVSSITRTSVAIADNRSRTTTSDDSSDCLSEIDMLDHPLCTLHDPALTNMPLYYLTIATWNVLADSYIAHHYYPHCNHLDWSDRFPLILQHIQRADADILCLQEVDHWDAYVVPLGQLGYEYIYLQRPGGRIDGCAICYKRDKIELVRHCPIQMNALSNLPFVDSARLEKHCVALMAVFRPKMSRHLSSSKEFCVVTTHIFWNPVFEDVKCLQVHYLMVELEKFWPIQERLFLCGDFNSTPNSAITKFLLEGKVDLRTWDPEAIAGKRNNENCESWAALGLNAVAAREAPSITHYFHCDNQRIGGLNDLSSELMNRTDLARYRSKTPMTNDHHLEHHDEIISDQLALFHRIRLPILKHHFKLTSVYSPYYAHLRLVAKNINRERLEKKIKSLVEDQRRSFEPITTNFSLFTGTLDYIFLGKGIIPIQYRRLPLRSEWEDIGLLPTKSFASDHLLLMAQIGFINNDKDESILTNQIQETNWEDHVNI